MPEMPVNDAGANRTLDLIVKRLEALTSEVEGLRRDLREAREREERRSVEKARRTRR